MGYIKPIWIICIVSLLAAFFFNYLNVNSLPEHHLRNHTTVVTNDDLSYLRPAEEFYRTGQWKDQIPGNISNFLRPPGYGILYYFCLLISESHALLILKVFQVLLFTLSVYCLYKVSLFLVQRDRTALMIAAIYGITPFAMGFLSYTLTEGITPALVIFYVYFLTKGYQVYSKEAKNLHFTLASLVFAYLFITRPVLGILGLLLPIFILLVYKRWLKKMILFGVIASSFMAIWQIRNYQFDHKIVGLHPIYYQDHNSIYRPPLKAFWNFALGWNESVPKVHGYMIPFWKSALKGNTSITEVNKVVDQLPDFVITHYGRDRLTRIFKAYQKAIIIQKPYYEQHLPMPSSIVLEEQNVVKELNTLTAEFKHEFWFTYYIKSPFKVFIKMAFHSNLSMHVFQATFRGNYLMEFFRIVFVALHACCFIALLLHLILFKRGARVGYALYLTVFIYVFYLCFFQRGIEERYALPILPILLIGLFSQLELWLNRFHFQISNPLKFSLSKKR